MDFRPLEPTERQRLIDALRGNAQSGQAIVMNERDTSFAGTTDEISDQEVISAIKSVPCHYWIEVRMSSFRRVRGSRCSSSRHAEKPARGGCYKAAEIPVIERYNQGRDPEFRIKLVRQAGGLILRYQLKPAHNVYLLETRLYPSYPTTPPETRIVTPIKHCPCTSAGPGADVPVETGSTPGKRKPLGPGPNSTCIFAIQLPRGAGSPATRSGTTPATGSFGFRSRRP